MDVEYSVSKRGVVTYKETGNPIPSKIIENTDEFETINQFVVEHIQKKLTKKLGLKKVLVPFQSSDENRTYILMSTDFTSNTEKLLVFVPTKGEISPGQWSKKRCITHSLRAGSMLSQIAEAITEGYAIIILNPNEPGIQNETPEEHLTYVFKHFISKSPAKFKFFWGHGFGGKWIVNLLNEQKKLFTEEISAIALVDSVEFSIEDSKNKAYLLNVCRHWVVSDDPLDKEIIVYHAKTQTVSGGSKLSCKVNIVSMSSILKFFQSFHSPEKNLKKRKRKEEKEEKTQDSEDNQGFTIEIDISASEDEEEEE